MAAERAGHFRFLFNKKGVRMFFPPRNRRRSQRSQIARPLQGCISERFESRVMLSAQVITPSQTVIDAGASESVTFDVTYETTDPVNAKTTGLVVRMHYDSSELTPDLTAMSNSAFAGATVTDNADASDLDNDANTDRYVEIEIVDGTSNFPENVDLPITLLTAAFETSANFGGTSIEFTGDPATGFDFASAPVQINSTVSTGDVTVEIGNAVSVNEGGDLVFPITLSAPAPAGGVSVQVSTVNGTAIGGADFQVLTNQTVMFAEGEQTGQVVVQTLTDADIEGNESLSVMLTGATGAMLGTMTTGTGVILDVEGPPGGVDTGNVNVELRGRRLNINGDELGNSFEMTTDVDGNIVITGIGDTTINQQSQITVNTQGINGLRIFIDSGAGNDFIRLDGIQSSKTMKIYTGAGDDTLVGAFVTAMRSMIVDTGSGNDTVGFDDLVVERTARMSTGSGDDRVGLNNVYVGRKARIDMDSGNDILLVANSNVNRGARIDLGDGDDLFGGIDGSVDGSVRLSGGNGTDTYELDNFAIGGRTRVSGFEFDSFSDEDVDLVTAFLDDLSALGFDTNI